MFVSAFLPASVCVCGCVWMCVMCVHMRKSMNHRFSDSITSPDLVLCSRTVCSTATHMYGITQTGCISDDYRIPLTLMLLKIPSGSLLQDCLLHAYAIYLAGTDTESTKVQHNSPLSYKRRMTGPVSLLSIHAFTHGPHWPSALLLFTEAVGVSHAGWQETSSQS